MPDDDKTYPIQPPGDGESDAPAPDAQPKQDLDDEDDIQVSRGVEPLPLEDIDLEELQKARQAEEAAEAEEPPAFQPEVADDSDYVHSLDICPNCGKSMGGTDNLICVHCGFDLKTMRVIETKQGVVTEDEVEAEIEARQRRQPISRRGLGNYIAPGIMAGASLLILLIGFLARSPWLIVDETENRVAALAVSLLWLIPLIGSAYGAVYVLSLLLERRMGREKLVLARVAGIVCVMRLSLFVPPIYGEFVIQALVAAGIGYGLSLLFFRIKARDAAILVSTGFVIFVLFYLVVLLFGALT